MLCPTGAFYESILLYTQEIFLIRLPSAVFTWELCCGTVHALLCIILGRRDILEDQGGSADNRASRHSGNRIIGMHYEDPLKIKNTNKEVRK